MDPTAPATFYHFVPHLSRKSFIVKKKLASLHPTRTRNLEIAKSSG